MWISLDWRTVVKSILYQERLKRGWIEWLVDIDVPWLFISVNKYKRNNPTPISEHKHNRFLRSRRLVAHELRNRKSGTVDDIIYIANLGVISFLFAPEIFANISGSDKAQNPSLPELLTMHIECFTERVLEKKAKCESNSCLKSSSSLIVQ